MTPTKKAIELVDKFMTIDSDSEIFDGFKMKQFYAQRCALIAVDNIIAANPHSNPLNTEVHSTIQYWMYVKTEISKL